MGPLNELYRAVSNSQRILCYWRRPILFVVVPPRFPRHPLLTLFDSVIYQRWRRVKAAGVGASNVGLQTKGFYSYYLPLSYPPL